MASLGSHSFRDNDGNIYSLELDFDDNAITKDMVAVTIKGKKDFANGAPSISVDFTVALEIGETRRIIIRHGDLDIAMIDLPTELQPDDVVAEGIADLAWDVFSSLVAKAEFVEEFIDRIPSGDPILGCLIKAGISTTVGQLLKCYREFRDLSEWRAIARGVLRCLGANSARMVATAIWRTGKCALLLGF